VLRELGNFTHRQRDGGRVHQYMQRLKEQSEGFSRGTVKELRLDLVFTEAQIADALNGELARYGLAPLSQVRDPRVVPTAQARSRQVQLVMLATLQHVSMLDDQDKPFGGLELWVAPSAFQLMCGVTVKVPRGQVCIATQVLEVGNDFCPVSPEEQYIQPPNQGVWRVFVEGGHTRLHGLW
jgi:hypothetical protein